MDGPLTIEELDIIWPKLGGKEGAHSLDMWSAVAEVHCPWRCAHLNINAETPFAVQSARQHTVKPALSGTVVEQELVICFFWFESDCRPPCN